MGADATGKEAAPACDREPQPMALAPNDLAVIRGVPLFAGLAPDALAALFRDSSAQSLPVGTLLFSQDEPADRFYVLLSGWIKLFRLSEDGTEVVIAMMARAETFAEAAMFGSGRFPVCAEALTAIRVVALSALSFERTLRDHPAIVYAMLGSMSVRLRQLVREVEQLQSRSAPERVATFLLRACPEPADGRDSWDLDLPLHKAVIAKRLGMRPETFSRALAKLEAEGVRRREGGVTITSLARLRAFCGPDAAAAPVRAPCS